jgi:hypothetical protein
MYSLAQLRRGLKRGASSPNLFLREANRLYHRKLYREPYNTDGVDVFAEDWDNLIVLDACRYDMFEATHDLDGHLSSRISRGAHTSEFLIGNFHQRDLTDTVYVTASPILHRGKGEKYEPNLHAIVNVWERDGWNEDQKTVMPETMLKYAKEAAERYPNKRIVVHMMQPHYPFIDSGMDADKGTVPDPDEIENDIWEQLFTGELSVSREDVWRAYIGNLRRAYPAVEEMIEELDGKTVVTGDHGNMIGERASPFPIREWGHPPGVYTEELTKVPWLAVEAETRRDIVAEEPSASTEDEDDVEEDVVEDRLKHLGYAEM